MYAGDAIGGAPEKGHGRWWQRWWHLRTSLAGSVGDLLEWYDFAVFGYFAPFISVQFFPAADPVAALINTFGVFAAGYLVRPIGGVLFARIGDRLGRARVLQLSIFVILRISPLRFVVDHSSSR